MSKIGKVISLMTLPARTAEEKMTRRILGDNCFFRNLRNLEMNETISKVMSNKYMAALDNFVKQENTTVHFSPIKNDAIMMIVKKEGLSPHAAAVRIGKDDKIGDFLRNIYAEVEKLMHLDMFPPKPYKPKSELHGFFTNISHSVQDFKIDILRKLAKMDNKLGDTIYETYYTQLYK